MYGGLKELTNALSDGILSEQKPKIFIGLLLGLALYPPNLKSVALPVPEIRGGS